ncbi:hypothetical protein JQ616_04265 [Bradyrhizobium tropiciagri]|uniref:hypothetical protein n=1 Tax=Bradyrhizobium tropiciagri TaxID=312253 RepID=UPI001BA982AB|nr:hypothetical protein [Bradyrhizobium tropiciagri]MBR0894154.1 hypothetical protein [Bradyrhizobium tropiciagri]
MSSSLSSNAADRMVEVLAGSTALLANSSGGLSDLPLSVTSVLPDDSTADTAAVQPAHGLIDPLPATNALDSATSLLGDGASDLPLVGSLFNTSDLPAIGNVLNAALPVEPDSTAITASGGTLQPVLDTADTAVQSAVHSAADLLSQATALPDALHGVTNLGQAIDLGGISTIGTSSGGHANLVADILEVPGQILAGNLGETIAHLGAGITDVVHVVSGLVDTVVSDVSGLLSPVSGLVGQLTHGLLDGGLLNLGGDTAGGGGLLGDLLGGLTGSSSGHLAGVTIGPQQPGGPTLDVLATPTSSDHHTADVSAIDTGQTGPHLLDLSALTGAHSLNIPNLGGIGADGLAGNLLGSLNLSLLGDNGAAGHAASAPASAPLDLGAVGHDLLSPLIHDHGILDAHGTHIL